MLLIAVLSKVIGTLTTRHYLLLWKIRIVAEVELSRSILQKDIYSKIAV
ncbi:hypothetical protein [Pleionea sp. CnH1-48]|nr:hypothetical protein [Pleionea sp. CnH1-48]MCO7227336.1 hypothetical protein [Pleionea sp. CnH1-48]